MLRWQRLAPMQLAWLWGPDCIAYCCRIIDCYREALHALPEKLSPAGLERVKEDARCIRHLFVSHQVLAVGEILPRYKLLKVSMLLKPRRHLFTCMPAHLGPEDLQHIQLILKRSCGRC